MLPARRDFMKSAVQKLSADNFYRAVVRGQLPSDSRDFDVTPFVEKQAPRVQGCRARCKQIRCSESF